MFNFLHRLSLPALLLLANSLQAASFDCQKAVIFVEKAICQESVLSKLDDELKAAFDVAVSHSKDVAELKRQQFDWLKTKRNICQKNDCLEQVYQERITVLKAMNSTLINTAPAAETVEADVAGQYVRYAKNGKPDYHAASLTLFLLEKNKLKISGSAMWVGGLKTGAVHTGEVDGMLPLQGNQAHYQEESGCSFNLRFSKNSMTVSDDNGQCGGANVSFNGYYKKTVIVP